MSGEISQMLDPKILIEARRIRRNLQRRKIRYARRKDLGGDCGLASLLLARDLNKPDSLRLNDAHCWNEFNGIIVDITATQFNGMFNKPPVKGVLVTKDRQWYHDRIEKTGLLAYEELKEWYDLGDYALWYQLDSLWE